MVRLGALKPNISGGKVPKKELVNLFRKLKTVGSEIEHMGAVSICVGATVRAHNEDGPPGDLD